MDAIVAHASYTTLLALRATCSKLRAQVDRRLVRHVLVWPGGVTSSRLWPLGRLPRDWAADPELLNALQAMDVHEDAMLGKSQCCFTGLTARRLRMVRRLRYWQQARRQGDPRPPAVGGAGGVR
jgi:hypothetical protein